MKTFKPIILELILIFGGVLVFRSLWSIMDSINLFNGIYAHMVLLIVGVILSIFGIHKLSLD